MQIEGFEIKNYRLFRDAKTVDLLCVMQAPGAVAFEICRLDKYFPGGASQARGECAVSRCWRRGGPLQCEQLGHLGEAAS